jgi:Exonuclease VII small subunit
MIDPTAVTFEQGYARLQEIAERVTSEQVPVAEMCDLFAEGKGLQTALTTYLDDQRAASRRSSGAMASCHSASSHRHHRNRTRSQPTEPTPVRLRPTRWETVRRTTTSHSDWARDETAVRICRKRNRCVATAWHVRASTS